MWQSIVFIVLSVCVASSGAFAQDSTAQSKHWAFEAFIGFGHKGDFEPEYEQPEYGTLTEYFRPDLEFGCIFYYVEYTKLKLGLELSYGIERRETRFEPVDSIFQQGMDKDQVYYSQHNLRLLAHVLYPIEVKPKWRLTPGIQSGIEAYFGERSRKIYELSNGRVITNKSTEFEPDFSTLFPVVGAGLHLEYQMKPKLYLGLMSRFNVSFREANGWSDNSWMLTFAPCIGF